MDSDLTFRTRRFQILIDAEGHPATASATRMPSSAALTMPPA